MRGSGALVARAAGVFGEGLLNTSYQRPYIDLTTGESWVMVFNQGQAPFKIKANTTAMLQYDEWKAVDRAVIEAAVLRLTGVMDLRTRGLEHPLGSIGNTVSIFDTQSDMTPANVSMSAVTAGEKDTVAYSPRIVPVPIVHKDFQVELRRLTASRRFGEGIDVTQATISGRLVAEKTEHMLFNGNDDISVTDAAVGSSRIYGYTTHPDRNLVDMEIPWDEINQDSNHLIIADVMAMQQASRNDRYYGPWVIYIPAAYEAKLDEDYRGIQSGDTRTVRQRILALSGIEDIKVADFLTGDNVVMVNMQKDVVDLAIAQDITTVQWQTMGGMQEDFKVMAVWVPRIKSDFDGRSGIVHLTPLPS